MPRLPKTYSNAFLSIIGPSENGGIGEGDNSECQDQRPHNGDPFKRLVSESGPILHIEIQRQTIGNQNHSL